MLVLRSELGVPGTASAAGCPNELVRSRLLRLAECGADARADLGDAPREVCLLTQRLSGDRVLHVAPAQNHGRNARPEAPECLGLLRQLVRRHEDQDVAPHKHCMGDFGQQHADDVGLPYADRHSQHERGYRVIGIKPIDAREECTQRLLDCPAGVLERVPGRRLPAVRAFPGASDGPESLLLLRAI